MSFKNSFKWNQKENVFHICNCNSLDEKFECVFTKESPTSIDKIRVFKKFKKFSKASINPFSKAYLKSEHREDNNENEETHSKEITIEVRDQILIETLGKVIIS